MVDTNSKGWRSRNKCIKWLESIGFSVAIIERTGRFVTPKDAFGLFDILAVYKNHTLLIQVASNKPHTHHKLQEFANKFGGSNLFIVQYVWEDHNGQKVYLYSDITGEHHNADFSAIIS